MGAHIWKRNGGGNGGDAFVVRPQQAARPGAGDRHGGVAAVTGRKRKLVWSRADAATTVQQSPTSAPAAQQVANAALQPGAGARRDAIGADGPSAPAAASTQAAAAAAAQQQAAKRRRPGPESAAQERSAGGRSPAASAAAAAAAAHGRPFVSTNGYGLSADAVDFKPAGVLPRPQQLLHLVQTT